MAKKKGVFSGAADAAFSYMVDGFVPVVTERIKGGTDEVLAHVEARARTLSKNLFRYIGAGLAFGLAGIFAFIALIFFLFETLGLSKTLVFLFAGILLLITGFILKPRGVYYDKKNIAEVHHTYQYD
jgi:hypothetical protein